MSVCETLLAPGIAAFNLLTNAGLLCQLAEFDDTLAALCKKGLNTVVAEALLPVHHEILCAVLCCCNLHPNIGSSDQNLKQSCVRQTLDKADELLEFRSRYKAEVSYNMRAKPPEPLMDKDEAGNLTTRPLRYGSIPRMLNRIKRDYPNTPPLGEKDIRRPDVVIVRDPTKPPTQDNIAQVVEMKFKGDVYGRGQLEDYDAIDPAGDTMTLDEKTCGCSDEDRTRRQVHLITTSKTLWDAQPSTLERVVWGVGTGVLVVVTIAAVLSPFEGPAGEAAAGTAAANTAARAAGYVALNQGLRKVASVAAVAAWSQIYNPGSR
ncbi:MAG TPA: VRR-NUC domain-containing protein [Longimicrobiaceae bacterium]|nr:VRR-NUC domain-containing protein [Longimicrobiaceae bacterium]